MLDANLVIGREIWFGGFLKTKLQEKCQTEGKIINLMNLERMWTKEIFFIPFKNSDINQIANILKSSPVLPIDDSSILLLSSRYGSSTLRLQNKPTFSNIKGGKTINSKPHKTNTQKFKIFFSKKQEDYPFSNSTTENFEATHQENFIIPKNKEKKKKTKDPTKKEKDKKKRKWNV